MPTKAYEQGFYSVFQLIKTATSRWREAVRSGELGLEGGEALKARMGVDPLREAEGMYTGWRQRARKAKYDAFEPKVRGIPGAVQSLINNGMTPQFENRLQVAKAVSGNGVVPVLKATTVSPDAAAALLLDNKSRLKYLGSQNFRRQLGGALASHEGSEISHAGQLAKSKIYQSFIDNEVGRRNAQIAGGIVGPVEASLKAMGQIPKDYTTTIAERSMAGLQGPLSQVISGAHASPRVLLEEVRNNRMLSPDVQNAMLKLRGKGEGQELRNIKAVTGDNLNIPRKSIPGMSRTMYASNEKVLNMLRGEFAKGEAQGGKGLLRNTLKILPGAGLARRLLGR